MKSDEHTEIEPPTKRHCPQCTLEVPLAAKICTHCGSRLDWPRYLFVSQATLALILSLLALSANFWDGYKGLVSTVEDWFSGTNLDLHAHGGEIDEESITVVVESRRPYPISVFDISCNLTILVDQNSFLRDQLTYRREGGGTLDNETDWVGWDVIGRFVTDYDIGEPVVVEPFGEAAITGKIGHLGLAGAFEEPIRTIAEGERPPVGTCWVLGANARHGGQAGGVVFYQPDLISVDPRELLENADLGTDSRVENLRISLIEQLETIIENGGPEHELDAIGGKNADDQF